MYTFTITSTDATNISSVPSESIEVLPLAMTPINIGTYFVGKTLVIVSKATTSPDGYWERIFDFHRFNYSNPDGDDTNTFIFCPFKNNSGRFVFNRKAPSNGFNIATSTNTNYYPARNTT